MGIIILVIVGILAWFFISMGKNNKRCELSSKMNTFDFESKVKKVLDEFMINYRSREENSLGKEYIFSKSFEFKSSVEFEKFSTIMQNNITGFLEKHKLMLKLAETEKDFLNDGIMYSTPFHKESYVLGVAVFKTDKNKNYYILVTVFDVDELRIGQLSKMIDKEKEGDINFDKKIKLHADVEKFIKDYEIPFINFNADAENIFLCKILILTKEQLNKYFEYYENKGMIKKGIPYEAKAGIYTDKHVANLADFLASKGYKFTENFSNPEKKEHNKTRYYMNIEDWAVCMISETLTETKLYISLIIKNN